MLMVLSYINACNGELIQRFQGSYTLASSLLRLFMSIKPFGIDLHSLGKFICIYEVCALLKR